MKSKRQKRKEAAERIKIEIDKIEALPADQICDWRLRSLKSQYQQLINYKTTEEKIKESILNKKVLSKYSLEDYLNDMEEYEGGN